MCRRRLARRSSARACAALSLYLRIARLLPFEFGTVILAARALLTASTGVFILTRTHRACSFLYSSVSSSVSRNIFGTASTTNSLSCADAHTHGHQSAHTHASKMRGAHIALGHLFVRRPRVGLHLELGLLVVRDHDHLQHLVLVCARWARVITAATHAAAVAASPTVLPAAAAACQQDEARREHH